MIAAAMAMGTFTVREIAERTGYSVHGAWAALQSMTEMAIGRVSAVRGCRGRTRFVVSSDATANVPSTVTEKPSKDNEHRVVEGTFHDRPLIEPVRDGLAAWKALRATLVVG
jgi:DNA-binding transcriptional regulator GbsR (MarR family)